MLYENKFFKVDVLTFDDLAYLQDRWPQFNIFHDGMIPYSYVVTNAITNVEEYYSSNLASCLAFVEHHTVILDKYMGKKQYEQNLLN
jgi:hypothetical protein